ncbi:hypothetical protein VSU16_04680 [Cetobacterium somerae]|uniref:hypothetical protein n=1 Tax=Cetobacterium somerae TaxID=188913 RepID=UPI002E7AC63C|nr:hypothetical protein [Cetobacterium somerae]WVJ02039.1 hypothetical protein VSU16_04680 [Cetobacterium somerae]
MNISEKMGLYLLEKMDNDLESNKNQIKVKEEVIEKNRSIQCTVSRTNRRVET